jgi:hypothetical protein
MCQDTERWQPGHLKRSPPFQFATDHGDWSIGTRLTCQDGAHDVQNMNASVTLPPTGSSTSGSISADPGQPQTLPVYRILVQENRVVANCGRKHKRRESQLRIAKIGHVEGRYSGMGAQARSFRALATKRSADVRALRFGTISARPILGGLHHKYCRM